MRPIKVALREVVLAAQRVEVVAARNGELNSDHRILSEAIHKVATCLADLISTLASNGVVQEMPDY